MADAASVLTPPSPLAPKVGAGTKAAVPASTTPSTGKSPYEQLMSQLGSAERGEADEMKALAEQERAHQDAYDTERGSMSAPTFEQVKFEPPTPTSPYQAWGSAAMTVALLGSLFTRQPLMTAMNSAASALSAYQKGDTEAYNAAYKKYEVDARNAMTAYDHQMKAYEQSLADITRREARTDAEDREQRQDIHDRWLAVATATRDDAMLAALQDRTMNEASNLQIKRMVAGQEYKLRQNQLDDHESWRHSVEAFNQSTPEFAALDARAKAGDAGAVWQLHEAQRAAGLWPKEKDPLQDPRFITTATAKWETSPAGKARANASLANEQIQTAAASPDITTNGQAQLLMVDRFLNMSTGSTRPGLAQFHKAIQAQSARARIENATKGVVTGSFLAPEAIQQIRTLAQQEADGAEQNYKDWLRADPIRRKQAQMWGELPEDAASSEPDKPTSEPGSPIMSGDVKAGGQSYPVTDGMITVNGKRYHVFGDRNNPDVEEVK